MYSSGAIKKSQFWLKIKEIFREILTEESILNHKVEESAGDFFAYLKNRAGIAVAYLEKFLDKLKSLKNLNWEEELNKYAKEPYSKITVLAVANLAVFIWLAGSGTFSNLIPNYIVAYIPSALGAEVDEQTSLSPGINPESNDKGIIPESTKLEGNDISEAKCEEDKEEGRCSNLCADIERYIKMTKDMSEEEKRGWEKYIKSKPKLLPSSRAHAGAAISCSKDTKGARRSDTKGKHMDEDCCPDPDEWPKPGCRYSAAGLALMMKGPR